MENLEVNLHKDSFTQARKTPYSGDLNTYISARIEKGIEEKNPNSLKVKEIMLNNQVVSTDQKGGSICFILQDEGTKGYRHGIIHGNNVFVSDIEKIDGIHKEINDIRIISHEGENIRYGIKSPREISIKSFDVSNNKNTDIDIIKIRNYQLKTTETNGRLEIDLIGSLRGLSMAMNKDNIVVMFVEDELQNNIAERNSLMAVAKNDELHLPNNISGSTLHPLLKNEQIKALIENFRA